MIAEVFLLKTTNRAKMIIMAPLRTTRTLVTEPTMATVFEAPSPLLLLYVTVPISYLKFRPTITYKNEKIFGMTLVNDFTFTITLASLTPFGGSLGTRHVYWMRQ